MSTELENDKGDTVAIRFFGGKDRGMLVDVLMPESVAALVGTMRVSEETTPELQTTFAEWIDDMQNKGFRIRYDREVRLEQPSSRKRSV